ncbi:hypothetical protein [Sphingomonas sp. PB4P5]|uniref:hypothetical protein n=1 Tax=Parasphingomonas puruogangriensis TaxID=3096155 RepID=UPI002FC9025A
MTVTPALRRRWPWPEYAMTIPIVFGIAYTIWFFVEYHYLPQPFFYEPSGTWMDWYSLTQWSQHQGAYDVAQTIYPPLSFVLMRLFTFPRCYELTYSEEARSCDWIGGVALTGMWVINIVLTYLSFRKIDRATAVPRTFAITCGYPMLFAFERGNVLIFCYACMLLGFGPLLKSARLRWVFAACALNFKVYLISAVVAPLLRRRWVAVEGTIICSVLVYLATWYILGEGSPAQIIRNIRNYSGGFGAAAALDLWFASSYIPVQTLMTGTFPVYVVVSSNQADMIVLGVTTFTRSIQLLIVGAAVATWLRPEVVPPYRMVYLATALALSASEAGGYTEILLFMFIFMEPWKGIGRKTAITIAYFLCISFDISLGKVPPVVRDSFLGQAEVIAEYGVGIMSLLRPGLNLIATAILAAITILDVRKDILAQGWQSRWRYRSDLAVFPNILTPLPPARSGGAGKEK